ncbi:hemolysin family protein [Rudaeicoccus suwonensis]|uniref:CBS domain containing-hemolysin-like protein n=1 Tax=Rudaeicoccus suwonensis TaxID=657409 RepID=A0A561E1J1_9MICO|nr:hemolysin family protein [Rudaeicoccus suwonensis]TWE09479.1 CBS domain containing-hemolysin-like protein [Rudaeicoccus suwonensis]
MSLWLSLLCLLGNAFFVGAEFAVMTARRSQLEPLAAAGSRRAKLCLDALENVASLLACAQLGITVCSVLLGAVAESAIHHLLTSPLHAAGLPEDASDVIALILALLFVAYCHVVIGEMVPKNLAIAGPDRAALVLAPALLEITRLLRPVISLVEAIAKFAVRRMGVEPRDEAASTFSAEEVEIIVAESHREGLLPAQQRARVQGALQFTDRVAADVAVPVDELIALQVGATPADIERLVAKRGFSRYPVLDRAGVIAGYLHLKDVLYATDEAYAEPVPPKRIRRLATVGPGDEVEDVLLTMQRTGAHLARVVDPDGEVRGVVFLEDVLEELVGEVTDATQR